MRELVQSLKIALPLATLLGAGAAWFAASIAVACNLLARECPPGPGDLLVTPGILGALVVAYVFVSVLILGAVANMCATWEIR